MKVVIIILLCISFIYASDEDTDVVKTSELELFLFKVGFQSLLKDVDYNKDISIKNKNEINELNNKVKLIMDEIYKEKRIIRTDSFNKENTSTSKDEVNKLKDQIDILNKQMKLLLNKKNPNLYYNHLDKLDKYNNQKFKKEFFNSPPNYYTINIASLTDITNVGFFLNYYKITDKSFVFTVGKKRQKIKVMYGSYSTKEKVLNELNNLPKDLVESNKPYIERISKKQDLYKKYNKEKFINEIEVNENVLEKNNYIVRIRVDEVNIREKPNNDSKILEVLTKDDIVKIDFCNSYGWCKLKGEDGFLAKFLLSFEVN